MGQGRMALYLHSPLDFWSSSWSSAAKLVETSENVCKLRQCTVCPSTRHIIAVADECYYHVMHVNACAATVYLKCHIWQWRSTAVELHCVCLWLIYTSFQSGNETELVKAPSRELNVVRENIITMFSFYLPTYAASRVLIGLDYCYK